MENIFPWFSDLQHPQPIHVVWVPSKPSRYGTLRHVVPAVCSAGPYGAHIEECAFEGLSCCIKTSKANPQHNPSWVECTLCGQWVHDICVHVKAEDIGEDDPFLCGCDRLTQTICSLESNDWYNQLTLDLCKSLVNFKDVVEDTQPSLRRYVFNHDGFRMLRRSLRIGRYGPFQNDNLIDSILEELLKFISREKQNLVPDVYLPEVLLRIVEKKEKVNRLLAEKILLDYSALHFM
ncbi:unnamed protein product [Mytilus edulis]|uniref:Uncharacterized protein n=1 Tax=Mytilus edulis TaxID=6550 RepID=A0A8S3TWX8_MYTED|nr:unnamed protein product [Mytilus edulis]